MGQVVTLMGWAFRRRDHGGLVFIDLRHREELTHCVFNPATSGGAHARAEAMRSEFVLAACGTVAAQPTGTENPKLATGAVEEARPLPFQLDDEMLRLKHRYLHMRRPHVRRAFQIRDQVCGRRETTCTPRASSRSGRPFSLARPRKGRDFLVRRFGGAGQRYE